mgnify:FL=1
MKKLYNYFSNNLFKCGLIFVLLVSVSIIVFSNSFAVELPVSSVVYTSSAFDYDANEEGAWKITKYATWISKNKAMITYNLNTIAPENRSSTDYILVVDGSLNERNSNFSSAIKKMLTNMFDNGRNRVALIGFNNTASLITDFSYDDTSLNVALDSFLTESITAKKEISYYSAFSKIAEFMEGYTPEDAENVKVVFVTDGKPVIDSPKEVSIYQELKNNYSNLSFLAIQYEMGDEVVQEIKNISDEQIVVNANNVWNVLSNIYFGQDYYDSFVLSDYFREPFKILNVKTINGTADILSDHSVEWNLMTSSFGAGGKASMTIYVEASSDYNIGDILPVTDTTIVNYSYNGGGDRLESIDTPTLATAFNVIYDSNTPASCTVTNMPSNTLTGIYDVVKPISQVPKCNGYSFKGWELVTDGIKINNDGSFIMPYKNVTYRAKWSKVSLNKSLDGTMAGSATLYDVVASAATLDTANAVGSGNGVYTYYSTANDEYPVHYYHGNVTNNNVVFGNKCWKIVRTTSTGGVKLVYNGSYLSGNCREASKGLKLTVFNDNSDSLAYVGYMYGDVIKTQNLSKTATWSNVLDISQSKTISLSKAMGTTKYYFGTAMTNSGSTYTISSSSAVAFNSALQVNKYTCLEGSRSCTSPVYIFSGSNKTAKYIPGVLKMGKSVSYSNGNYTITDATDYLATQYVDMDLNGYYVCPSYNTNTCTSVYYISSLLKNISYTLDYITLSNGTSLSALQTQGNNTKWIFGNDVTWNGTTYTLKDTVSLTAISLPSKIAALTKGYNYTCFSTSNTCSTVNYMVSNKVSSETNKIDISYYALTNGDTLDTIKSKIFSNKTSSKVKQEVDTIWSTLFSNYTKYLENTDWCNDRTFYSGSLKSKDSVIDDNYFMNSRYNKPSIVCTNSNDSLSVGNGLTYPVALLTRDELDLGGTYLTTSSYNYWTLSPDEVNYYYLGINYISMYINKISIKKNYVIDENYIRPAISLMHDIKVEDGDGTASNPYILKLQ